MRSRPLKGRRTWPQRFIILGNLGLAVACAGLATTFRIVKSEAQKIDTVQIRLPSSRPVTAAAGQTRNILLVGGDDAAGLNEDDPVLNSRDTGYSNADVIMVLRLDPANNAARLLSIPRDTWVPVAPGWGKSKINSALGGPGGPENLVATVERNFGIPIDNFVQVNFAAFKKLVELLGGIPVYLEHPVRDRHTGLWLVETGCITLDPEQALAYARSRHFQYQEGSTYNKNATWLSDPSSDWGRITRQQDFLRKAGQRAIDVGIRSPRTVLSLLQAGLDAVTVDPNTNLGVVIDLLDQFQSFGVDGLSSFQIPTVSSRRTGTDSLDVVWDDGAPLLEEFLGLSETERDPRDVMVSIPEDSNIDPNVRDTLLNEGWAISPNAPFDSDERSNEVVIRYGESGLLSARTLAARLGGNAVLRLDETLRGQRLVASIPAKAVPSLPSEAVPLDQVAEPTSTTSRRSTQASTTSTTSLVASTTTRGTDPVAVPSTEAPDPGPTTTLPGLNPIAADVQEKCKS
jgi:LCP family protein required for cell wall assembly